MLTPGKVPWRVVAAGVLAGGIFGAGWIANGWRKEAEIAELTAARAQADLASANTAISDLREAGSRIRKSADDYLEIKSDLGAKLDAIRKDLKHAKPLPVDCRPDAQRVRGLSDAVDAAKQAAAAR
ncbi:hypothetical protein C7414_102369 [Cupriavidus alkaliphilus]|uniref:hypothetical protein n=1 Tax=Cupriavidus alkaliphilus TaxID=942866 RepID=UPI000DE6117E|nr:hypothetical protein [Cupriavidus alkaliphilus]PVY81041.1 hypothetical protein C7414_102369 [Cupriavidus alkaliphilus]